MMQPPSPQELFERFVAAKGGGSQRALSARASANEALVLRYFEMWNTGDGSIADQVLGSTYMDHAHPEVLGPAALRSLVPRFRAANPGAAMRVEIAAADDEHVAVRNAISRVVDGEATESEGIALFRVAGEKLVEQWSWYPDAELELAGAAPRSSREVWLSFRA
jgi:predicted SnoaL-like aldol condensation-catalyzing enzyme